MKENNIFECIKIFTKSIDNALSYQKNYIATTSFDSNNLFARFNNQDLIHILCEISINKLLELIDSINNYSLKKYDIFNIKDIKRELIFYTENYITSYITLKLFKKDSLFSIMRDNSPLITLLNSPFPKSSSIFCFLKDEFPETNSIFQKLEKQTSIDSEKYVLELTDIMCQTGELEFAKKNICTYIISSIKYNSKVKALDISSEIKNRLGKLKINNVIESNIKDLTVSIPINELKQTYLNWFFDNKSMNANGNLALKNYTTKVSMLNNYYIPFMLSYTWNFLNYLTPKYIVTEFITDKIQSGMIFTHSSKDRDTLLKENKLKYTNYIYLNHNENGFKYKDYLYLNNIRLDLTHYERIKTNILKNFRHIYSVYDISKQAIKSYSDMNKITSKEYIDEMAHYIEECIYVSISLCNERQIDIMELSKNFCIEGKDFDINSDYFPIWRFVKSFNPIQKLSKSICDELYYIFDTNKIPISYVNDISLKHNFFGSNIKGTIISKAQNYDAFKQFIIDFICNIENSSLTEKMKIYKLNSLERVYCFNFICTIFKYITFNKRLSKLTLDKKLSFIDSISILNKIPLITYRKKLLKKYLNDFIQDNLDIISLVTHINQITDTINYSILFVVNIIKNVDNTILTNLLNNSMLPEKFQVFKEINLNSNVKWYKKIIYSMYNELEDL